MAKHVVAKVSDIPDGGRVLVELQGRSIGVFNVNGKFYALLNRCPHQGAELCRGSILGHLEAPVPGELKYDNSRFLLQCPWHGWEYDMETGQSYFDSSVRPYRVGVEAGEGLLDEEPPAAEAGCTTGERAMGLSAPQLKKGPYRAEVFPISIDDDYVVVTLPGGRRRRDEQG